MLDIQVLGHNKYLFPYVTFITFPALDTSDF